VTSPYEDGNPSSKLCVLGQAPGRTEIKFDRPLVGPAGSMFKECLHAAGLARSACYILNVWEDEVFTTTKGDIFSKSGGPMLWGKKGFTEYGLELASPCLERIRNSGANCILPLGQQALELCTGQYDKVMKWRGSIQLGLDRIGKRKVVGTVHPAAVIRGNYLWKYLIISDMKKAVNESRTSELNLPERSIHIRPSLADVRHYIRHCVNKKIVATDLEVINHQVSCFSLCTDPSEAMVVPLTCESGDYWDEEDEFIIWQDYSGLMHNREVVKVNQNIIGFDAPFLLMQNHIHTQGEMWDPMIAQSVLYPEFNKGLDFIASIHTREPYWKDEGKMWKNEGGDFPTFWRYNGKDACVALEAWYVLAAELTQRDMWHTYNLTANLAQPLMYMTVHGLAIDRDRLEKTKEEINEEIMQKEQELGKVAEYPFNPGSPSQCQKYFYETKGLKPYKNATGGVTTDDKAMSRIFRKTQMPEAKLVQEIRSLRKLKSSYLDVTVDKDGRLRCSWNPRGTKFGRLSSSQTIFGTGMNLQNLDPRFKSFIIEDQL
jgi:uracil-DNA glycosylase